MKTVTFLIQCEDRKGLVCEITSFFFRKGFNIVHCQQHSDSRINRYFMRIKLDMDGIQSTRRDIENDFAAFASAYPLEWSMHFSDAVRRTAIMVTKESHCLYDLLLRWKESELNCEIPLIISNHPDLEYVASQFRIPFYCLPVGDDKQSQEMHVLELLAKNHVDLLVLAKYMRVLGAELVSTYKNRLINIHHAFLPAFQGASPYRQAYERGVKMIGATAHYVTDELDEGPIIEQDVERVNHEHEPEELRRIGKDIERLVLARAVKAHLENRIIVCGRRTIVFS